MRIAPLVLAICTCTYACGPTVYPIRGQHHGAPFEGELSVELLHQQRRFLLNVRGLPEPQRLSPTARFYIAWIVSPRRGAARISRVDFDDLERIARFDERSDDEGDLVRITAEANSWAREPSAVVLLERQIEGWVLSD